ncbi:MAG TPA: hypothetical protein VFZ53_15375 [Polyangiaceae bacterium]
MLIGASSAAVLAGSASAHANQTPAPPPVETTEPVAPAAPAAPAAGAVVVAPKEPADVGTAAPVPAAEPPPVAAPKAAAEPAGEPTKPKKGKKKRLSTEGAVAGESGLGSVEVGGRVFARAAFARQPRIVVDDTGTPVEEDVDSLDMSVPSARLRARYRAPVKWLSAEIEADFAPDPELKDAYVRARPDHLLVQAGQFKVPFSAIRLESPWDLPIVDRGVVDDVLVDRFQIAGRRPGWAVGVRTKAGIRPELVVGTFQGSVLDDVTTGDFDPIEELALDSQSLAARATVRIGDVALGAGYEHRVGSPAELEIEHYATGNLDAVIDTPIGSGGLRVWAEGIAGESWYEHEAKPVDGEDAFFVCLRLIAGYRFGGAGYGELYVEPYGMISGLDPDTEVTSDGVLEGALGVNVGLWDLVRVGLQGELVRAGRNFPRSVYLGQALDRTALLLQAGVQF